MENNENINFEESLEKLEEIVLKLENGDVPLDDEIEEELEGDVELDSKEEEIEESEELEEGEIPEEEVPEEIPEKKQKPKIQIVGVVGNFKKKDIEEKAEENPEEKSKSIIRLSCDLEFTYELRYSQNCKIKIIR